MKILVMSDTHGSVESFEKLERFVKDADILLHLGDVLYHGPRNPLPVGYDPAKLAERLKNLNVKYVRGNCDADVDLMVLELVDMPKTRYMHVPPFEILALHGETLVDRADFALRSGANVLLYGHTHIPFLDVEKNVLLVNPGSVSLPKGGYPPSFAFLSIDGSVLKAEIVSLKGEVMKERRFQP